MYVIKLLGQTMSPLSAEIQERCVSNLNVEYIGQPIEECALELNIDLNVHEWFVSHKILIMISSLAMTLSMWENTNYPLDIHLATNLMD